MRNIGLLAALAFAATTSVIIANSFLCGDAPSGTSAPRILALLSSVYIPGVRFEGITLDDTVARLNKYAADTGANFGKPAFVLWKETDPLPANFRRFSPHEQAYMREKYGRRTITKPSADGPDETSLAHATSIPTTISLSIDSDSLYGVADKIASQANHCLEEDVEGQQVLILPEFVLYPPIVTKEYYLDDDPLPSLGLPRAKPTNTHIDLRPVLEPNGVYFLPGCFAYYEPKQRRIVVRGQRVDVELVQALLTPTAMYNSPCERRRSHFEDLWWQATRHLPSFIRPSLRTIP